MPPASLLSSLSFSLSSTSNSSSSSSSCFDFFFLFFFAALLSIPSDRSRYIYMYIKLVFDGWGERKRERERFYGEILWPLIFRPTVLQFEKRIRLFRVSSSILSHEDRVIILYFSLFSNIYASLIGGRWDNGVKENGACTQRRIR